VRNAVSEVEQALVNLDATAARAGDAQTALEGYRANYSAVEDRYKNGMASLFELEDAPPHALAPSKPSSTCSANAAPRGSPCTAPPAAASPRQPLSPPTNPN
jgi:hypothetical protein